jgi:hypothetical protein
MQSAQPERSKPQAAEFLGQANRRPTEFDGVVPQDPIKRDLAVYMLMEPKPVRLSRQHARDPLLQRLKIRFLDCPGHKNSLSLLVPKSMPLPTCHNKGRARKDHRSDLSEAMIGHA